MHNFAKYPPYDPNFTTQSMFNSSFSQSENQSPCKRADLIESHPLEPEIIPSDKEIVHQMVNLCEKVSDENFAKHFSEIPIASYKMSRVSARFQTLKNSIKIR